MTHWLDRYTMNTSFDDFSSVPSAVNPYPHKIGQRGFQVTRDEYAGNPSHANEYTAIDYTDNRTVVFGELPILEPAHPTSFATYKYSHGPRAGRLRELNRWQSAEDFWSQIGHSIVECEILEEGISSIYNETSSVILEHAVSPHAGGVVGAFNYDTVLDHRAVINGLLDLATAHASSGNWKAAGGIRELTSSYVPFGPEGSEVSCGAIRDWADGSNGLANILTGFSDEQMLKYADLVGSAGQHQALYIGTQSLHAVMTGPYLRSLAVAVDSDPFSEPSNKLARAYQQECDATRRSLQITQAYLDRFCDREDIPSVDLIPRIEELSGQPLQDLYGIPGR